MDLEYPTVEVPATPEYVLAVLQDLFQQSYQFVLGTDADGLTFESKVSWLLAEADAGPVELGLLLEGVWGLKYSKEAWQTLLTPDRTFGEVCAFLAQQVRMPLVRPARVAGMECLPAGVFLTVRSLLHQAGAPAENIAPSTPLEPFLKKHPSVFLDAIPRLAPGTVPLVQRHAPAHQRANLAVTFSFLTMAVGVWLQWGELAASGGVALLVWSFARLFLAERLRPARYFLGNLCTFRDLSLALARHCQPAVS